MDFDCGAIRHLDLSDPLQEVGCDPHRPRITVDIDDKCEIGEKVIAVSIGSLWGQPTRHIDLKPDEARKFARYLNEKADELDIQKVSDDR